jgi:hypothetical protein
LPSARADAIVALVGLPGRRARLFTALVAAAIAALCAAGPVQASVFSELEKELHKIKGKVHTDGTLTVSGQETITVTGLPGKYRLQGFVSAPPTAQECFQSFYTYCEPEPLFRVPGTPKFRSSKKGRARLTSVVPPGYQVENFKDPLKSHPVYFINGQTVHVEVYTTVTRKVENGSFSVTGPIARSIARVEVPQPPAS